MTEPIDQRDDTTPATRRPCDCAERERPQKWPDDTVPNSGPPAPIDYDAYE